ncbi:MAG: DUF349 domain-containing protein [Paramuribaculum sp.]|nr:DUF349 domain-containing protein [Paramuribaculum sp.]
MELLERTDAPATDASSETTLNETAAQEQQSEIVKDEPITREGLLASVTVMAKETEPAAISAEEVARIKQQFYSLHNEAVRAERAAFIEAGNAPEAFTPQPDAIEEEFKALLSEVKEKKAAYRAEVEALQEANLDRKRAIIDELSRMGDDADTVNIHYQRVKELQADFKAIGEVPAQQATEIWKAYQEAVEKFYDQWKVNKELRDYDFKKNLGEKQLLIDEAVKLSEEPDVITAFRRLQELHDKWRDIGPVAKEIRDEVWTRFKDASAEVSKRYQAHFEARKQQERANEEAKTALCERIEAIDLDSLKSNRAWDETTEKVIEAQKEWKAIGQASRKTNAALFARFRARCDEFFTCKAEFFKEMRETHAANLAAKTALCEKAEALAESTDWRKTTDLIQQLQKEWKTLGPVGRKQSDAVWQRFLKACDTFFDRKKAALSASRKTELANLSAKRDIIARLQAMAADPSATPRKEAIETLNDLRKQWQATGHVPFKEKDKLQEAYREVVGDLFDKLDIRETRSRMESFEADIEAAGGDSARLSRERDRLLRAYEQRKQELATYENNLGFFSSKSKSGDSMLKEMERKIQRIKSDIEELARKIAIIDSKA